VQNTDNVVLVKARKIRPLAHAQLWGASRMIFVRCIRHSEGTARRGIPRHRWKTRPWASFDSAALSGRAPGTPLRPCSGSRLVTATTRAAGATDRTNRWAG
jgi:hypothetical protein